MTFVTAAFGAKYFWGGVAIASAVMVLVSSIADRRRQRRRRIDDVGFMPWTGITAVAVLATVVAVALAIKSP